ncbi:DUF3307 domain-containing protein [Kitasatospora sp. NPDC051170]|uniref:DUF3307 domain-containing protein n=1 Tax=Kitasatospora sp. NPDC051170 TaxID=3364056 RepID=UPI0037953142
MFPHSAVLAATAAFFLMFIGHFAGDYLFQTDHMAEHKAAPGRDGWHANSQHVLIHLAGLFGVFTVARIFLDFAPPAWPTLAAFAWVSLSHGLIDRRWPITWWMTHTHSAGFLARGGAPLVDQAAHIVVGLFPAAVLVGSWC